EHRSGSRRTSMVAEVEERPWQRTQRNVHGCGRRGTSNAEERPRQWTLQMMTPRMRQYSAADVAEAIDVNPADVANGHDRQRQNASRRRQKASRQMQKEEYAG
ncbi:putative serine/threonine-protein kinase, partial [Sesbania bispinosa]